MEYAEWDYEPIFYSLKNAAIDKIISHCFSKYGQKDYMGQIITAQQCAVDSLKKLEEEKLIGPEGSVNFEINGYFARMSDASPAYVNENEESK